MTNVTDFGLFLELEEGIEGLVHVSEIASDKRGNPLSRFQVDDVIQAKVLTVSREEKKIGLSIKKLDEGSEKEALRSYMDNSGEATSNLGDLLREEMTNLEQQTLSDDSGLEDSDGPEDTIEAQQDSQEETVDNSSSESPSQDTSSI